ncbi:hypothetical protein SADUNF_Sadunf08G0157600 [Salix dunnii]|uniref:Uncharacterized protein n=1 Tax=Salix dunnii TaxID=1413687 RepID=A0A835MYB5_9ROSI|nr:hypothetical protein SADUNF_Sadunf08G0157600 [Salix dunnii]
MPSNIVVEQIKLINNRLKLIIAVVVIDEPSLYSKPGVIGRGASSAPPSTLSSPRRLTVT